jgi:hypothetical protein
MSNFYARWLLDPNQGPAHRVEAVVECESYALAPHLSSTSSLVVA